MKDRSNIPRQGGASIAVIVVIVIIGAILAGLHFTGKLQPLLDSLTGKKGAPAPPAEVQKTEPVEKIPEPVEKPKPEIAEKQAPEAEEEPAPEAEEDTALEAAYRAKFKPPQIGQKITLSLKGNVLKTGILRHLDENSVKLKMEKIEMTLAREQLGPVGLARCYEDEYVRLMVAAHKNREKMAKLQKQRLAKLHDEYIKFMASKGKKVDASDSGTWEKQSIDDVDFKKWMEENGQTELLKARKQRMKEYEAQRIKEGRAY